MSTTPTTLTRKQFAEHLGVRPSYITKLGKAGRLVFTEDGRHVVVEATKRLMEESRDPNRQDVTDRHRAKRNGESAPTPDVHVPGQPLTHSQAKASKEFYLAENARLDYEERCGRLLERDAVRLVIADAAATLRAYLESLPAQLAPHLAGSDEERIQALLAEHVEVALTEMTQKLASIGGEK